MVRVRFFDKEDSLTPNVVWGSSGRVMSGVGATRRDPGNCDIGWLPNESTMIVGADAADNSERSTDPTIAEWDIQLSRKEINDSKGAYVVIACARALGGLHTQKHGAIARVCLNGRDLDIISLKDRPTGHSDFFHRPFVSSPRGGWPDPIGGCGTIYSWHVDSTHLQAEGQAQTLRVWLDSGVGWDIDHVGVIVIEEERHLSEFTVNMIYLLIGAALSFAATLLTLGD